MVYCLAIDIGASSGRHLLGHLENGKLITEEIYRFENGMKNEDGTLIWDIEGLTAHVIAGIAKCAERLLAEEQAKDLGCCSRSWCASSDPGETALCGGISLCFSDDQGLYDVQKEMTRIVSHT